MTCLATSSSKSTERRRFSGFAGTGPTVEIPDAAAGVVASLRSVSAREKHCEGLGMTLVFGNELDEAKVAA